jgi:hypothetical protein
VLLLVPESAFEEFEVPLVADPPLLALAVWLAPPATPEPFAPLFPLLLNVESSLELDVPAAPAIAVSVEPEVVLVLVSVLAFVPDALPVWVPVLALLAFNASLDEELFVAPFELAVLAAEVAELVLDALLLELSFAPKFLLEVWLAVSLSVSIELFVSVELLLAL